MRRLAGLECIPLSPIQSLRDWFGYGVLQLPRKKVLHTAVVLLLSSCLLQAGNQSKELSARVQTQNGKAMPGIVVVCVAPNTNAVLDGTKIEGGSERFRTDAIGMN